MLYELWRAGRVTSAQMTPNERRAVNLIVIEEALAELRRNDR